MRALSGLTVLAIVAIFLLPSTIAIYTAVNGTEWDLFDVPVGELLIPALVVGFVLAFTLAGGLSPATPEITHPIQSRARLFELDCALIC